MAETSNIPRHVAIIMDGNGRWARNRGEERIFGHFKGVDSVREVIKAARRNGVEFLTLYVFSTENWGRPREEVDGLMELLCKSVLEETDELMENGVNVKIIGDREAMPEKVKRHLTILEDETSAGDKMTLVLALNYGSREEITCAVKNIARDVLDDKMRVDEITPELISSKLYTGGIPDPDLLIRTSGEIRLSNYLLWQTAYTEFYFTDVLWPDFGQDEFDKALKAYSLRERRYGLINKQKP